jgi:hypothetical protein
MGFNSAFKGLRRTVLKCLQLKPTFAHSDKETFDCNILFQNVLRIYCELEEGLGHAAGGAVG